jgi:hypothetical protein
VLHLEAAGELDPAAHVAVVRRLEGDDHLAVLVVLLERRARSERLMSMQPSSL